QPAMRAIAQGPESLDRPPAGRPGTPRRATVSKRCRRVAVAWASFGFQSLRREKPWAMRVESQGQSSSVRLRTSDRPVPFACERASEYQSGQTLRIIRTTLVHSTADRRNSLDSLKPKNAITPAIRFGRELMSAVDSAHRLETG